MSEHFDINQEYNANQQCKIYNLQGQSLAALQRAIEISNGETLENDEKLRLAGILGLTTSVERKDSVYGHAGIFPEIFHDPFSNPDAFYMISPIGMKDMNIVHFKPLDGIELNSEESEALMSRLFPPHSGAIPIVSRAPVEAQKSLEGYAPHVS